MIAELILTDPVRAFQMPETPRLPELRRQRALVQEHLAWLDREIATEEGKQSATDPLGLTVSLSARLPAPAALTGPMPAAVAATEIAADSILKDYRTPTVKLQQDVRRGCFLYFAAALLAVAATVVALYFGLRHR